MSGGRCWVDAYQRTWGDGAAGVCCVRSVRGAQAAPEGFPGHTESGERGFIALIIEL